MSFCCQRRWHHSTDCFPHSPYLLSRLMTLQELLHSLAQLGRMSGRAVLLPDVPCSAPWVQQAPGGAASLPLRLDDTFVPHGRLGPSGLRCTSNLYLRWNCQKAGQAVISAEYDHWWSTLPADKQAELRPGRHNTVLRPDVKTKRHLRRLRRSSYNSSVMRLGAVNSSGSAGGAVSNMTFARSSLADEVLTVDAGAVAELLYQHDSQQVLYLAHPVVVWERPVPSGAVAGLEEGAGGPPPPPPSQRPPPCALLKSNSAGGEAACKRLAKGETLYHQMASECEIFSLSAYNWHNKEGPRSDYNHWKQGAAARIKRASLLPEGVLHYDTSAAQL